MEVINTEMRKGIKLMAIACQTAQFVSLMPKPKDFATRLIGDIVYLSTDVKKLSEKMNKLLDSYANIPTDYLMVQLDNITDSLTGVTNRLSTFTQNGVKQVYEVGENTMEILTTLTGNAITTAGKAVNAIDSLSSSMDIEVEMEWNNNHFTKISNSATSSFVDATQKISDGKNKIVNNINDTTTKITDVIEEKKAVVITETIEKLREAMSKMEQKIDSAFGLDKVESTLIVEGDNSALYEVVSNFSDVIKNFSIGKTVSAFAGLLTQVGIVSVGLDRLPPIDLERMMYKICDPEPMTIQDLYEGYDRLLNSTLYNPETYADMQYYSDEKYNEFLKKYEDELKEQRNKIRMQIKSADKSKALAAKDDETAKEMVSAIEELKKFRGEIGNAKQAKKLKNALKDELNNFFKEIEYRCKQIKSDWTFMLTQYKDAINEIKEFFSNGGSCDQYIDDCCKKINQDCDGIKELCKNIGKDLIFTSIKLLMPSDLGPVVPNPGYKLPDFAKDILTIFNFIRKLIEYIMDILDNINKLARLMLNGLNNLKEIIDQLIEIIGLKWLMELVQNIINLFGQNITNARDRLINTLSPVYFSDTEEYENTMEAFEELEETGTGDNAKVKLTSQMKSNLGSIADILDTVNTSKKIDKLVASVKSASNAKGSMKLSDIEDLIEDLEDRGDTVVAYKSPIIEAIGKDNNVSDLVNGDSMEADIKFMGWYFYHPNLIHKNFYTSKLRLRLKSRYIKKAAKRSNKQNGGVAQLQNPKGKKFGKGNVKIGAYEAFFWYTYYTEDLEKDCFERKADYKDIYIDGTVKTQNGSIVTLSDGRQVFVANNNVKKGDYVTVDGVKYRVNK